MKFLLLAVLGLVIGCIGGMVGIGGGVLLIPALTELFKVDPRKAAGMTLAAMVPPVTLPAAWRYYDLKILSAADLGLAACIAVAFALGAFLGAGLQARIDVSLLRLLFGLLMLYVAVRLIIHSDNEAVNAAAGLVATATAWLGLLGLRSLGRRHSPPRSLGEQIRSAAEQSSGPPDYII
ncbi:MAG: TSUP family transporter [Planctomycetes bacterium]|nr:TSUP family transporter [Planctomycetota bacterium]